MVAGGIAMPDAEQCLLNLDFLKPIEEKLLLWLFKNAQGRANAYKRKQIADIFRISEREVSQIIKDLIEVHGMMITTDSTGIFIPQTLEEYLDGRNAIILRIKSLKVRVQKIDRLIKKKFSYDSYLDL